MDDTTSSRERSTRMKRLPAHLSNESVLLCYHPPHSEDLCGNDPGENHPPHQLRQLSTPSTISGPNIVATPEAQSERSSRAQPQPTMQKTTSPHRSVAREESSRHCSTVGKPLELTDANVGASVLPSTEILGSAPVSRKRSKKAYIRKSKDKGPKPDPQLPPYLAAAYARALWDLDAQDSAPRIGVRVPRKMWYSQCPMTGSITELDFLTSDDEETAAPDAEHDPFAQHSFDPTVHLADLQDDLARLVYRQIAVDFKNVHEDWQNRTEAVLRLNRNDYLWVDATKRTIYGQPPAQCFTPLDSLDSEATLALEEQARKWNWVPPLHDDFDWTQEDIGQQGEINRDDIARFKTFLEERGISCDAIPLVFEVSDEAEDADEPEGQDDVAA